MRVHDAAHRSIAWFRGERHTAILMRKQSLTGLRRQLPSSAQLSAQQHFNELSELDSARSGEFFAEHPSVCRDREVDGFFPADNGLLDRAHARTMRIKSETANENAHNAHKIIAVCAQNAHPADAMATTNTTNKKGKHPTNLTLDAELVDVAQKFFPTTRDKSLSRFVERALRAAFRKHAAKIKGAGIAMPETIFTKAK